MYKVFVNDKPIFLTTEKVSGAISLKNADIAIVAEKLARGNRESVYLYHADEENIVSRFKKKLPVVIAAGGLVRNNEDDVLFIKRNGKWDLPKGGVEHKEAIEAAAIRETEEETGVQGLKIVKPLQVTYHIFNRNGNMKLKETYWFEMTTGYTGEFTPQKNEGITKVRWKNAKKTQEALKNSYANIRELFILL